MDIGKLNYFIQAAESLNFTEVAKKNYVTQPAISRHIAELESQLGVKLFLRVGHVVRLTSEGEMFLTEARKIIKQIEDATASVRRLAEGKSGKLSIGMVNTSSFALKKCLYEFSNSYPGVQVNVKAMVGGEIEKAILGNELDFYFGDSYMIPDRGYDYTITGVDRFHLIAPSFHRLEELTDLNSLKDEPFVTIDSKAAPNLYRIIMEICGRRSYVPNIVSTYNRLEGVMISIAAGIGISILPGATNEIFSFGGVKSFPMPGDDCQLPSAIIWSKNTANPSAVKFREIIERFYPPAPN